MLLLVSLVPFLFLIPSASSQGVLVTTSTETAYSNSFTVQGTDTGFCYFQAVKLATEWDGSELFGSVTATVPIQFAIMNQAQYNSTNGHVFKSNNCRLAAEAIMYQDSVTHYTVDWVVPDSGTYYFIFFNPNSASTSVTFGLWAREVSTVRTTAQTSAPMPTTYQSTNTMPTTSLASNPTATSTHSTPSLPMPSITQTLTNNQNRQVPFFEVNTSWLLPLLVVAIAAIVTFILVANALPRLRSGTTKRK